LSNSVNKQTNTHTHTHTQVKAEQQVTTWQCWRAFSLRLLSSWLNIIVTKYF